MESMTLEQQRAQRDAMRDFISETAWSFVLRGVARERWGREVTTHIAERGTNKAIRVKGWTNTATGTIFMREEIFDGINFMDSRHTRIVRAISRMLGAGLPINPQSLAYHSSVYGFHFTPGTSAAKTVWQIAQTVVANYGVFGHEYCHAAYSEHAARNAWHMGLEDLRAESLWMAQDPIRARQGLRACASFWVAHDSSPMAGEQLLDLSEVETHADLLHLYLLIGGRGRIGVLDDQSALVVRVRDLAVEVLGYEVVSDADDIIDRYLETPEGLEEGAAERRALAEEFANLLPKAAGRPKPNIGCACDPQDQAKPDTTDDADESDPGEGGDGGQDGPPSPGQDGQDGQDSDGGRDGDQDSENGQGGRDGEGEGQDGQDGSQGGQDGPEGQEDGQDGTGGQDSPDEGQEGQGGSESGGQDGPVSDGEADGTSEEEGGRGSTKGSGGGDDSDDDGEGGDDDALTVGTTGSTSADTGDSGDAPTDEPDFVTGQYGETIRPGAENVTDKIDDADAFRLTTEQVEELTEILTEGLEEINDDESAAGWSMSNEEGAVLTSRSTAPAKVAGEVFSKAAFATRNRRIKTTNRRSQ